MADMEKTVKIVFAGDDQTSGPAKSAIDNVDKVAESADKLNRSFSESAGAMKASIDKASALADKISAPFARAADAVLATDAALLALAVGGLAYAYIKAVDFESASTSLAQVLEEELLPQIPRIQREALALSSAYGVSATSVLDSTVEFKKAGFALDDSLNMAEAAMRLVIAAAEAGYEVGNASSDIIAIMKGFNAEASQTTRVTDILNKVSNDYATSVVELSGGMAKLAPLSSQAGFSFEETAGLLVPVIERFRSGSEASEAFKTTLLRLSSNTKTVTDALDILGVSQKDSNGQMRSSRDIYFDVAKAFKTVDESMKPVLVQMLAGTNHAGKMIVAFDGLKLSTAVTNTALQATGAVAGEVSLKMATAEVALARYGVSLQNLGIVVGTEFKDSITGAISGMTEIQSVLQQLVSSGAFDDLFDGLRRMGGGLEAFFRDVAKALPEAMENVDFSGLTTSLEGLGDAIMSLFGELDLRKAQDLEVFIQTAVDMLKGLVNITSGMVEGFKPFIDQIREFFLLMAQDDTEAQKAAGQILAIGKAVNALGLEFAAVLVGMNEFGIAASSVFNVVGGAVQVLWNTLTGTLRWLKLSFLEVQEASLALAEMVTFGGMSEQFGRDRARVEAEIAALKKSINEDGHDIFRGFERIGRGFGLIAEEAEGGSGSTAKMRTEVEKLANAPVPEIRVSTEQMEAARADIMAMGLDVSNLSDDVIMEFLIHKDEASWSALKTALDGLPPIHKVSVKPEVDTNYMEVVKGVFAGIDDEQNIIYYAGPDKPSVKKTKEELEKELSEEKKVKVYVELEKAKMAEETERIKAALDVVKSKVEWRAKLDIAEVESNAKKVEAIISGLSTTMESTGNVLGDLFDTWSSSGSFSDKWQIEKWVKEEMSLRKEAHNKQMEIADAEMRLMDAKMSALNKGDSLITIQGDGLAPHLEAFMWEVLSAIQVRVNEEGMDMLLGI
ncbi:phage tail tape measure protein [Desulfobotulus sp.]|uniref:phage tail tape measure protein n=1 Tax=Desulfobotulus sp. TaxID=1940337 RepID=UPI002A35CD68|nr:phage tail tape measure protein [Desulfobotulus sp.]MDY0164510.1 phage tail tape measure protein [Desulfobotulus sp.]